MTIFKNDSRKSAFSLIEVSIVIIVIGILIGGVVQGGKMLDKYRVQVARSLTSSSPAISITGLALWLDTTSAKSFNATVNDESGSNSVCQWFDINSQTMSVLSATQSDSNSCPIYKVNSDTKLPMLYFDGENDCLLLPDGTIPYADNSYTIFIVSVPIMDNITMDRTFLSAEEEENVKPQIIRYRREGDHTYLFYDYYEVQT